MKILYLSEANLRDRLFIRDLVNGFKGDEKYLVLHDTFGGTVSDTRFVTKRLSALMSESMVYNNAFSGDQRNFFSRNAEGLIDMNVDLIHKLMEVVQVLLIGPIITENGEAALGDPMELVQTARTLLEADELIVFTENPMSPLATKRELIDTAEDVDRLMKVYDEEKTSIELALSLRPARLVSPSNFAQ
ncbi:MAG: hypothetical protein AAF206_30290 [Bacteroidota bacterium]